MEGASQIVCAVCLWKSVCMRFVCVCICVYIDMQPGLSTIRHCLIYCSEVAVAGWDPLHLSPFLNGVSTVPPPIAVSHFNDLRNDCVCVYAHVCFFFFGSRIQRQSLATCAEDKTTSAIFLCLSWSSN